MERRLIVLEFNELTPALMDRFIDQGLLPNFKKLRDRSICFISDAQEDPPSLEPWIQWVSIHTGLPFSEHAVFDLGQGENLTTQRIWDRVAEMGSRSLVIGSMNAHFDQRNKNKIDLIPDPWAINLMPSPSGKYDTFYKFIRTYVQEYTSNKPPLGMKDYVQFIAFMAKTGLSAQTIKKILIQLLSEKAGAPKWKRAAILDRVLWDVFRHKWMELSPRYASVFLNSTAHLQHYYWREFEPQKFLIKSRTQSKNSNAILYGYRSMDQIVGECLLMAGDHTSIALITALGQQPMTKYDSSGGKLVFKIRDAKLLLQFCGYTGTFQYKPVMAEEFNLLFDTDEDAKCAYEGLNSLLIDNQKIMDVRMGSQTIFAGCTLIKEPEKNSKITSKFSHQELPFSKLFYPVDSIKSGMHHPDGIFWLSGPGIEHRIECEKLPITNIQNYLLDAMGLKRNVEVENILESS